MKDFKPTVIKQTNPRCTSLCHCGKCRQYDYCTCKDK